MAIIAHLDMDAFFAAIEERDNPQWQGLPIVVGADPAGGTGRGVVSTANYAARVYGIHSAMPITRAWRLSEDARKNGQPAALFLSGRFSRYAEESEAIMALVGLVSPTVVQRSVDEAYFDLSFLPDLASAEQVCRDLKKLIAQQTKLTASIGIGANKLIAKIASDFDKPDGLTIVPSEHAVEFLAPLPVRVIPGIGPKAAAHLHQAGIHTVGEAQRYTLPALQNILGNSWGASVYRKVRGQGDTVLVEEDERKSLGHQHTFAHDTRDPHTIISALLDIAADIEARRKRHQITGYRTITVTVRLANFTTHNRSHTLPAAASTRRVLEREALRLALPFLDRRENPSGQAIRLVGLRIENFAA